MIRSFRHFGVAVALVVFGVLLAPQTRAQTLSIDLPAQSLESSLRAISRIAQVNVLFDSKLVEGLNAPALTGNWTIEEAVRQLAAGTGLEVRQPVPGTITVSRVGGRPIADSAHSRIGGVDSAFRVAQSEVHASRKEDGEFSITKTTDDDGNEQNNSGTSSEDPNSRPGRGKDEGESLEEVVITGTHIRGLAPESSPLTIYDREFFEKAGVATIDQLARILPENFSATDLSTAGSQIGALSGGGISQRAFSEIGQSAINIHGLGPNGTLVLLNGRRLAPSGFDAGFVDVSAIPMSAIERVEVLTDGASALYGADAISGVMNFVLRKDIDGAETTIRRSGATRGGAEQLAVSQALGTSWSAGNGLLIANYDRHGGLLSQQRDFVPESITSVSLLPEAKSYSLFGTMHQDAFKDISLSASAFYSYRDYLAMGAGSIPSSSSYFPAAAKHNIYGGVLAVSRRLFGDWEGGITASYSRSESKTRNESRVLGLPDPVSPPLTSTTDASSTQINLQADGTLFSIRDRAIKLAVGAETRYDRTSTPFSQTFVGEDLTRDIASAFGELFFPIFGGSNTELFARRLEVSVAARYEHYTAVGSSTNPKIGLLWSPVNGLNLRGTYGRSFRVPLMDQLLSVPAYQVRNIPDPSAADGNTLTLINGSRGGALEPEESETVTAGFDIRPSYLPLFSLTATYFQTHFNNRLSYPSLTGGINALYLQEAALGLLINRFPNPTELQEIFANGWVFNPTEAPNGAASIEATFDSRLLNLSRSSVSGTDVSMSYVFKTPRGEIQTTLAGTYLFELGHQTLAANPWIDYVDRLGQPVDLRLRGGAGWSSGRFNSSLNVNFVSSYENTLFTPARPVESWTTVDVYLAYKWAREQRSLSILRDTKVSLSIQNVTDEDPPIVESPHILIGLNERYDSANASPVGRLIALQLSKSW